MTPRKSCLLATALFGLAIGTSAHAQEAEVKRLQPGAFQGLEVQKADPAATANYFTQLAATAADATRRKNTTTCFADRGDIIVLPEGIAIYCDGDVSDGEGRRLDYGAFVPQLYVLPASGKGALTVSNVLDVAQSATLRNLTHDQQLGESRFLVQGVAENGNTACPGWLLPVTAARGDTQCRTMTMAQSWAVPPKPKTGDDLPPATFRFDVVTNNSRPPLQCRRAGC